MQFNAVRVAAILAVLVLLYGSRLTKGSAKQTPEGLSFAMKPVVVGARVAALIFYVGFFGYTLATHRQHVPMWFPAFFLIAIGFILLQLPGTIVLGPDAVTQRFWFLKQRVIGYSEVMTIQAFAAGRAVRVLGDNRVVITHTNNHSAADRFRSELEQRTGKSMQP